MTVKSNIGLSFDIPLYTFCIGVIVSIWSSTHTRIYTHTHKQVCTCYSIIAHTIVLMIGSNKCRKRSPNQSNSSRSKKNELSGDESGRFSIGGRT